MLRKRTQAADPPSLGGALDADTPFRVADGARDPPLSARTWSACPSSRKGHHTRLLARREHELVHQLRRFVAAGSNENLSRLASRRTTEPTASPVDVATARARSGTFGNCSVFSS